MRILLVHNAYAKPSGEEQAVQSIADLLESQGHHVAWLTRCSAEVTGSLPRKVAATFGGIYNPLARAEISRLLDSTPIDIVQIQNLFPQISPAIIRPCRERGIPVVMRCPNYRLFCPQGLFLSGGEVCERCAGGREWNCVLRNCTGSRPKSVAYALRNAAIRLSRTILGQVSAFMVLSGFQRRKFIEYGIEPERLAVIPNFSAVVGEAGEWSPGGTVGFVGRISREKGLSQLIEAARAMPDIPFAVAGGWDGMPEIRESAPANVAFHGFLGGAALDEFYRRARLIVCPSIWYEGFPNVVARAMAAGKPVVACRIGAMPEIVVDHETGLLFEPGDIGSLVGHIRRIYHDESVCRAMGRAGRLRVEREYSPDAVYRKLMAVYWQALSRQSVSRSMPAPARAGT